MRCAKKVPTLYKPFVFEVPAIRVKLKVILPFRFVCKMKTNLLRAIMFTTFIRLGHLCV